MKDNQPTSSILVTSVNDDRFNEKLDEKVKEGFIPLCETFKVTTTAHSHIVIYSIIMNKY